MKKVAAYILIILLVIASHRTMYAATVTENVQYTLQRVMATLKDYFYQVFGYPAKPVVFEEPTQVDIASLSPLQQFFRNTITLTHETTNILANTASLVIAQAKEGQLSPKQISNQFINDLITANRNFITQALKETLDIDLQLLLPSLTAIAEYTTRLQKAIAPLEHVRLQGQIKALATYLETIQKTAADLQAAGLTKVSAALAAKALTGYEQTLVTQFNTVYNAYPTVITAINNLKIAGPGKIMQSAFNRASELIEHIIALHQSTGKLGTVLVQNDNIASLDMLKNNLRKLGNTIDFTTTTKPIIVVAPPTTHAALFTLLKTFVLDQGFKLKELVTNDMTTITNVLNELNKKMKDVVPAVSTLQKNSTTLSQRIQDQFVSAVKAAPLRTINRAPMVLFEIVEKEITAMKQQLNTILSNSALIIKDLSTMLATAAHLLPYVNQCMGATDQEPFVNPDIIRGIQFIADDTNAIRSTIDIINKGIHTY